MLLSVKNMQNMNISGNPAIPSSAGHAGGGGVAPSSDKKKYLSMKPWYYGAVSRSQCDELLNSRGHDGDYLIRDSETNVSS